MPEIYMLYLTYLSFNSRKLVLLSLCRGLKPRPFLSSLFSFVGIEPRALHILGKKDATKPHPSHSPVILFALLHNCKERVYIHRRYSGHILTLNEWWQLLLTTHTAALADQLPLTTTGTELNNPRGPSGLPCYS